MVIMENFSISYVMSKCIHGSTIVDSLLVPKNFTTARKSKELLPLFAFRKNVAAFSCFDKRSLDVEFLVEQGWRQGRARRL